MFCFHPETASAAVGALENFFWAIRMSYPGEVFFDICSIPWVKTSLLQKHQKETGPRIRP